MIPKLIKSKKANENYEIFSEDLMLTKRDSANALN